jgi:hypothetical protein
VTYIIIGLIGFIILVIYRSLIDGGLSRNSSPGRAQGFPPGGCNLCSWDIRVSVCSRHTPSYRVATSFGLLLLPSTLYKVCRLGLLQFLAFNLSCRVSCFWIPSHPLPYFCTRVTYSREKLILGSCGGLRPPTELLSGYFVLYMKSIGYEKNKWEY